NQRAVNLLDNLKYADLVWDTSYVDVGNKAFRSYMSGMWREDRRMADGTTFATAVARNSNLSFLVLNLNDKRILLRCKTNQRQRVVPFVNGNALPEISVGDHWTEYSFGVPKEFLVRGANTLSFEADSLGKGISVDYLKIQDNQSAERQVSAQQLPQ